MLPIDHLRHAIEIKGSQGKLAKAAGVSQTSIWKALQADRVSAELAVRIERATDGVITAHHLRPDLFDEPEVRAEKGRRYAAQVAGGLEPVIE